jgi:hypothetical protein
MAIPKIDEMNQKKPLCYDSLRRKFIYYNDIVTKKEPIILPSTLSDTDQKKLIIKRQQKGPDYKSQSISGPLMNRNDLVRAIRKGEKLGDVFVEAEISYLDELLREIQKNIE